MIDPGIRLFMNAGEIESLCDIKRTSAFKVIRELNEELDSMGKLTIRGKVQREYFYKKIYGYKKEQPQGKLFISADNMSKLCGIKKNTLLPKVRAINKKLEAEGWLVFPGKLPVNYFNKWIYGIDEVKDMQSDVMPAEKKSI